MIIKAYSHKLRQNIKKVKQSLIFWSKILQWGGGGLEKKAINSYTLFIACLYVRGFFFKCVGGGQTSRYCLR